MKILWFAWLRTRVGHAQETIAKPTEVSNVAELLDWLAKRSDGHAQALAARDVVRVAINQTYVKLDHPVADGDEIALFPPVTGG